jgi:hypothetical protein
MAKQILKVEEINFSENSIKTATGIASFQSGTAFINFKAEKYWDKETIAVPTFQDAAKVETLAEVGIELDFSAVIKKFTGMVEKAEIAEKADAIKKRKSNYDNHMLQVIYPLLKELPNCEVGFNFTRDEYAENSNQSLTIQIATDYLGKNYEMTVEIYKVWSNSSYHPRITGHKFQLNKGSRYDERPNRAKKAETLVKKAQEAIDSWKYNVENIIKSNQARNEEVDNKFEIAKQLSEATGFEVEFKTEKKWKHRYNRSDRGYEVTEDWFEVKGLMKIEIVTRDEKGNKVEGLYRVSGIRKSLSSEQLKGVLEAVS